MNQYVYSTDELLSDKEFDAWAKRFLKKKDTAIKVARLILNNK